MVFGFKKKKSPAGEMAGGRLPVLIIDDDADLQELLEYNLKIAGFKVLQAMNGPDGLEIARREIPKLILLDTTMPEMDGLEVLSELKHDKKTANILVFMLTGKTMMGDVEKAFEIGADDYITKPVELNKLGRTLREKLRKFANKT